MKAGDKVVCVRDDRQTNGTVHGGQDIKRGLVYVIREIRNDGNGDLGLWLVGLFGGSWYDGEEACFCVTRFRPVAEVGHPPIEIHVMQEVAQ
jgi:hypothetical protein